MSRPRKSWALSLCCLTAVFACSHAFMVTQSLRLRPTRLALSRHGATAKNRGRRTSSANMNTLLEDAPDKEGQTIGHWTEDKGTIRWALVEPDLAALKKEERDLEIAYQNLQQKASTFRELQEATPLPASYREETNAFSRADLDGTGNLTFEEWKHAFGSKEIDEAKLRMMFSQADTDRSGTVSLKEFVEDRLSKQLVGLKTKAEALRNTIEQYKPDEHAPECIAEGGQGSILVGKDLSTGEKVAIKVERVSKGVDSCLQSEFNVLYALQDDPGFPNIMHFGRQILNSRPSPTDCRVLVMNLLGASISDLWWETTRGTRGFIAATAILLAIQMLQLLEKLHDKGFVHRDVKPANFMMSGDGGKGRGRLCLIDFGLAVPLEEERKKEKTCEASRGSSSLIPTQIEFFGTVGYASVNAHNGDAQSYRDDLESLIYVFAFLLNGGLPWDQGRDLSIDKVGALKGITVAKIIAGEWEKSTAGGLVPSPGGEVIGELLSHCRALQFGEKPDYAFCRSALMKAYSSMTPFTDLVEEYEWNNPPKNAKPRGVDFMDLM